MEKLTEIKIFPVLIKTVKTRALVQEYTRLQIKQGITIKRHVLLRQAEGSMKLKLAYNDKGRRMCYD